MKDALNRDWVRCALGAAFSLGMTWAVFRNLPATAADHEKRIGVLEVRESQTCRGVHWLVRIEAKRAKIEPPDLGDCEVR